MMTSRRRYSLLILTILSVAFALRLYHLDFQSIWWDEGHSIFVAQQPIPQIPTLPAMDVHPPAYFALLHLWLAVAGQSEFALRYLSVIFSLLTVALLWRFAVSITHRLSLSSPLAPAYTALLAALSPLYVAYAQEVRSYATITFLALLSTYMLWRLLFISPPAVNRQQSAVGLYIIATAASLYTHYFTIFLLLFQNLAWLAWVVRGKLPVVSNQTKTTGRLKLWAASQIAIGLLFIPQLWLALRQVTSYTNPNLTPPTLATFIGHTWQAYTIGLTIAPTQAHWGMGTLLIIMIASWIYFFTSNHNSQFTVHYSQFITPALRAGASVHTFLFLAAWFLIPLLAYFLVLQRQPSFEPRYLILVTPGLLLLLGLGVSWAGDRWQGASRKVAGSKLQGAAFTFHASCFTLHALRFTLLTLPLLIFCLGLYSYYTAETYFKDDSAGVANWLASETTANDIVYFDVPHPFHYYAEQRQIPAPTRYLFVDIHTAADILSKEAAGRDRLFWVTWRGSDTDPRGVIPFLAEKFGRQLGQLDFRGYRVAWYSLPRSDDSTAFSLPDPLSPIEATFGDVLRLDGVAYGGKPPNGTSVVAGESAWVTLHFTLLRETDVDYRVSLRLRTETGQLIAQIDQDLLNDRHFRTSAWPLDDPALNQTINVYTLPIPADTPPGSYRLEVVVYDARPPYPGEGVTGPAQTEDGAAAVIGRLTVTP